MGDTAVGRAVRPSILMVCGLILLAGTALGQPEPSRRQQRQAEEAATLERRAALGATLARLDGVTFFALPTLTAGELAALADGELVRRREPPSEPGQPQRVVAWQWFELARSEVWIACQDPHLRVDESIQTLRLPPTASGHTRWYGLIDLPWPFKNRQWVIEVWDHHAVAERTDGESWEHPWRLDLSALPMALASIDAGEVPGLGPERAAKAIVTPINQGAWVVSEVGGGTLLVWHLTSSIGGSVPERLVVSNAFHSVERMFRTVERLARRKVRRHYDASHPTLYGGDGRPLPPYPESPR